MQEHVSRRKNSLGEQSFHVFNSLIMALVLVSTLYPFWYCLALSFNDAIDAAKGQIYLLPRSFSLDNYRFVLNNAYISVGFINSISRTVIGTLLHVIFTGLAAFGLSKKFLIGRKIYTTIFVITMYFNGGLIATYLLIRGVGLLDKFMVYIIPGMWSFFNAILFMAFYETIPDAMEESAYIDGANRFTIFFKIIVPISMPIIATVALFVGVGQWNSWFDTMIYTQSDSLVTLQSIMAKMIRESEALVELRKMMKLQNMSALTVTPKSVQVATMVVTTFPIVVIYPFLQKYFVKGIMLGSVKG